MYENTQRNNKIKGLLSCIHFWHVDISKSIYWLDIHSVKVWWKYVLSNFSLVRRPTAIFFKILIFQDYDFQANPKFQLMQYIQKSLTVFDNNSIESVIQAGPTKFSKQTNYSRSRVRHSSFYNKLYSL